MKTLYFRKNKSNTFEVLDGDFTLGRLIFFDSEGWKYDSYGKILLDMKEIKTILEWAQTHDRNGEIK